MLENPVLQRELLVNLRMARGFVLLFAYLAALSAAVLLAWPEENRLDLTGSPIAARRLVNMFFLGQYALAALMAPSFAAGAISGEKERRSYEMLLATPMRPAAIVAGKLLASLCPLAVLIFCTLPIVTLCLPLGGFSIYEIVAAYVNLIISAVTFGMISLAASSYFRRTASSLIVSYLLILPLALAGALLWAALEGAGSMRLLLLLTVVPGSTAVIAWILFVLAAERLLHTPDLGSEGKEAVDLEQEAQSAVGLVIQRDKFPDRLFAPAKRQDLLEEHANPVFDKEMRSEIFSQGTLMLRLVIQISMGLAIPLMAVLLFIQSWLAPWYITYVILFNMLVGPVFSAGSVTSERERQTLDLLLTTTLSPWSILRGKLFSALRVSSVLTMFLMWPVFLAVVMPIGYWSNLPTMLGYLLVVLTTCLTTSLTGLFCSTLFAKTSISLMVTYLWSGALFVLPVAMDTFAGMFLSSAAGAVLSWLSVPSPIAAVFALPLDMQLDTPLREGNLPLLAGFFLFTICYDMALWYALAWLFDRRWRVAG